MAGIDADLSITPYVNGLNYLIKRQRQANWMKKQDTFICYMQEIQLTGRQKNRVKGWKRIFQANRTGKLDS